MEALEAATRRLSLRQQPKSFYLLSSNDSQFQIPICDIVSASKQPQGRPGGKQQDQYRHRSHRAVSGIKQLARRLTSRLLPTTMDEQDQVDDQKGHVIQDDCMQTVTAMFPDICLEYLNKIAEPLHFDSELVINHIIDLQESGQPYTRRPVNIKLKRKRDDEIEEEAAKAKRKFTDPNRQALDKYHIAVPITKRMLAGDFRYVPMKIINNYLSEHGYLLHPTYLKLAEVTKTGSLDDAEVDWKFKKWPSPTPREYRVENILNYSDHCQPFERELIEELRTAREAREKICSNWQAKLDAERAEQLNFDEAKASGMVAECECCFAEAPLNRLIACNGEKIHLFCSDCARLNAETEIGLSRYELVCMSTEGCTAGFSHSEREKFLQQHHIAALDRIEKETVLRLANIENLATCPFCPYAEEYPSIDINKEFRCQNPDCGITSCRLCNAETHLPKSCEDVSREKGIDLRREVEEAMSAALIRKCNKCGYPFIKQSGCNLMRCTQKGCNSSQCYICSKPCNYSHFNDETRGGKKGNCTLFDVLEDRHDEDIKKAEEIAKKKVLEKHPGLDPSLLNFNIATTLL
ncbi:hypothetical protein NM208_g9405 [Fusarium decemcellulare]|uniref:Uncharacterized protein n=1 Tax=Fusarium decemcellulare TaxID=57161 RepID=A0ACC1S1Z2_9HYPO|nr:hypothetical protein NM208_g9405 [Fusarium decemcellulare]